MSSHFVLVRFFLDYPATFPFELFASLNDDEVGPALIELRKHEVHHPCTDFPDFPDNIPPRFPLAEFQTKEDADTARKALQRKVNEIKQAALCKNPYTSADVFFGNTANPWFSVVAAIALAPDERIIIQDKLQRLFKPKQEGMPFEEGCLRAYLPKLEPILSLCSAHTPVPQKVQTGASVGPTESETVDLPETPKQPLSPSRQKAYALYEWALQQAPELAGKTDLDVYKWLKTKPDLASDLPANADTFSTYLKEARRYHGTQKHVPRSGRSKGKSVVDQDQI